ncbi:Uncharacterised protein [uncultured archaeon]|nr:Uncharacterised protein [uncultured archaeon]
MLQINTMFRPYRLMLSRRAPVEMSLTIANTGKETAMVSFEISCGRELSFEKGGFKAMQTERIGEIPAGKKIERIFYIHGKPITRPGMYAISIKTTEHYKEYGLVQKEHLKKAEIIVE